MLEGWSLGLRCPTPALHATSARSPPSRLPHEGGPVLQDPSPSSSPFGELKLTTPGARGRQPFSRPPHLSSPLPPGRPHLIPASSLREARQQGCSRNHPAPPTPEDWAQPVRDPVHCPPTYGGTPALPGARAPSQPVPKRPVDGVPPGQTTAPTSGGADSRVSPMELQDPLQGPLLARQVLVGPQVLPDQRLFVISYFR